MAHDAASVDELNNPAPHANEGGRAMSEVGVPASTETGVRKRTFAHARPLKANAGRRTKKYRRVAVVRRRTIRDANLGRCCLSDAYRLRDCDGGRQADSDFESGRGYLFDTPSRSPHRARSKRRIPAIWLAGRLLDITNYVFRNIVRNARHVGRYDCPFHLAEVSHPAELLSLELVAGGAQLYPIDFKAKPKIGFCEIGRPQRWNVGTAANDKAPLEESCSMPSLP
jgi:hypothetical protein